ncbi:MAG: VWA domain-containing protein [Bacteroidales bacterium]|nr:VWA domain-containing protein [Bacteroidales bacterium]
MSFITNNGLFWLILSLALALIILLLIYIVRPNYQQRFVSSTFVWKLSLKYKKKKVPVDRIRNILIIICQVLIITACAFIIARPAISLMEDISVSEVVIVMDTSASMRTVNDEGDTRMERAVEEAYECGRETLEDGGIVSVLVCGDDEKFAVERAEGADRIQELRTVFDTILETGCTYASTDINAALTLCEERILNVNPDAVIHIYTDETYTYIPEGVEVTNVADREGGEWNAAITNAYSEKMDGYFALFVEFRTYGRESSVLSFDITFKNPQYVDETLDNEIYEDDGNTYFTLTAEVECSGDDVMTYIFMNSETFETTYESILGSDSSELYKVDYQPYYSIYYYEEIEITFTEDVEDSYDLDNVYYVYGGQSQVIRVLYTTVEEDSNKFVPAILSTIQSSYADVYDILVTYEYANSETIDNGKSGYDFYLYEHIAPQRLPEDGIVFLFDPDIAPDNSGFRIQSVYEDVSNYDTYLYTTDEGEESPLMHNVRSDSIFLTKASLLTDYDTEYTALMEFECAAGTYPALLMKDNGDSKILVMPFSLNYSNFALRADFPVFFNNIFSYFYPTTITGTEYLVGDTVEINTKGESFELWRLYDEILGIANDEKLLIMEAVDGEDYFVITEADGYEGLEITAPLTFTATKPGRYLIRTNSYFYNTDPRSQKKTEYYVFVHADFAESDIFSYASAISSPYKEKSLSELYDDLLLWFAIALVALVFIEWILHMLEGI